MLFIFCAWVDSCSGSGVCTRGSEQLMTAGATRIWCVRQKTQSLRWTTLFFYVSCELLTSHGVARLLSQLRLSRVSVKPSFSSRSPPQRTGILEVIFSVFFRQGHVDSRSVGSFNAPCNRTQAQRREGTPPTPAGGAQAQTAAGARAPATTRSAAPGKADHSTTGRKKRRRMI